MKLRRWQSECIALAIERYNSGCNHFLALATPGAGKTIMASELADQLLKKNLVDLVICFSPSSMVAQDFKESLHIITKERFDGLLGAKGRSLTYQSLQYLSASFWQLFNEFRVFVIFDEVHHCSGSNLENANMWGERIIINIQNKAKYTLALTGTPWRSDNSPIVLSNYLYPSNKISCDYIYGLSQAILDNVCRIPEIIAVDNNKISVRDSDGQETFDSFKALLSETSIPYQDVIENVDVIRYLISSADKKLNRIRKVNPNAAGLVIASSVEHANKISLIMKKYFDEESVIVTYMEQEPTSIIGRFRQADNKWIISVGMISEGTNIPRLQLCCHLTNIKTEMHFRQILGRILRMTQSANQEAVMYMPAEPTLLEYAYRVKQDVPFEADVVKFETIKTTIEGKVSKSLNIDENEIQTTASQPDTKQKTNLHLKDFERGLTPGYFEEDSDKHHLITSYNQVVSIFGRFKQESIALGLSDLR